MSVIDYLIIGGGGAGGTGTGAGGVLYLDTATPGGLTQTAPSGEDDAVKIVGHAATADVIYFNPSVNWIISKA